MLVLASLVHAWQPPVECWAPGPESHATVGLGVRCMRQCCQSILPRYLSSGLLPSEGDTCGWGERRRPGPLDALQVGSDKTQAVQGALLSLS